MTTISPDELAEYLTDFLERVRKQGEHFDIVRDGEVIARLEPGPRRGLTLQELIARVGDIYMPGDGFADAVEEVQASQPMLIPQNRPSSREETT